MGKRGRKVQRTISLENLTILHNFNNMAQQPVESFKAYLTAIRIMAESHEFG